MGGEGTVRAIGQHMPAMEKWDVDVIKVCRFRALRALEGRIALRGNSETHKTRGQLMRRAAPRMNWNRNAKQAAALVATFGFLALSVWLGDEVWSLAEYWPASGTGFGVTVGALLPITFTAAERAFGRVFSDGSACRRRWAAAGIVYGTVALVSALAAARAIPGKGSSATCRSEWQPCWVNHLYPGAFLATLGSLLVTVAVMHWLPNRMPHLLARYRR
ncbi:hypothetical protein DI272_00155 [Streptomyces sp. Act143]|uniref:hypothetical protein n=1 Tax=Streptomyces sp. Act143 TaxID=2200760 RepID=UPI000D680E62|nr:hypothetical protein [Streptomyces sp. Act143]PWI12749.1 hypothetical protein DI272_00155 [Streptomyces sp. Act143]